MNATSNTLHSTETTVLISIQELTPSALNVDTTAQKYIENIRDEYLHTPTRCISKRSYAESQEEISPCNHEAKDSFTIAETHSALQRSITLIHTDHNQKCIVHTISERILGKGNFAEIVDAGPSWVLRKPLRTTTEEEREHAVKKCRRTKELLTKIHKITPCIGIEDPPKEITYASTSTTHSFVSVSKRALGSGAELFSRIEPEDLPTIAYQLTQGLNICSHAHIGHIDIKPGNILLYGTEEQGKLHITEAKISDFEDAIHLESMRHNTAAVPEKWTFAHTPRFVLHQDLLRLKKAVSLFSIKTMIYQIAVFEMGAVLYQFYTKEPLPVELDNDGYIAKVDTQAVHTALTKTQLSYLECTTLINMLQEEKTKRPTPLEVSCVFILKAELPHG